MEKIVLDLESGEITADWDLVLASLLANNEAPELHTATDALRAERVETIIADEENVRYKWVIHYTTFAVTIGNDPKDGNKRSPAGMYYQVKRV